MLRRGLFYLVFIIFTLSIVECMPNVDQSDRLLLNLIDREPGILKDCADQGKPKIKCGIPVKERVINQKNEYVDTIKFPWFVSVVDQDQTYLFAGSLIHPQVVLTFRTLVERPNVASLSVEIESVTSKKTIQKRGVKAIDTHNRFNESDLLNDVALLILDSPIDMIEGVSTVCLPAYDEAYDSSRCLSGGWTLDTGDYYDYDAAGLKYINLNLMDGALCSSKLSSLGVKSLIHKSHICVDGSGGKTCDVEDGAPLFCQLEGSHSERYIQIGVGERDVDCGWMDIPGVYSAVKEAVPFISKTVLKRFGIDDFDYYTINHNL